MNQENPLLACGRTGRETRGWRHAILAASMGEHFLFGESIMNGLCKCGCGQLTKRLYVAGHQNRGKNNGQWRGGKSIKNGYTLSWNPSHPRANNNGYVRDHVVLAERALGKRLQDKVVVHHAGKDLVICQDQAYHMLLHVRHRAYKACGHASWRKCWICKKYDDPNNLCIPEGKSAHHPKCYKDYRKTKGN